MAAAASSQQFHHHRSSSSTTIQLILHQIWKYILIIWDFIKKLFCCGFCRNSGRSNPQRLIAARGVKIVRLPDARRLGCDEKDVENLLGPDFSPFFKRKYLNGQKRNNETKISVESDSDGSEEGKHKKGFRRNIRGGT
uniref:Uncharacterized protein n=1 Tax=Panagrolaimus sp. PS1159 TaxID=55785 RepID=A0AC35GTB4_9BILA